MPPCLPLRHSKFFYKEILPPLTWKKFCSALRSVVCFFFSRVRFSKKKREKATLSFHSDKQKIMLNSLIFISKEKSSFGARRRKGFLELLIPCDMSPSQMIIEKKKLNLSGEIDNLMRYYTKTFSRSVPGIAEHIHSLVFDRVLPPVSRNYSADIARRPAAGKIRAVYDDTRHV